MIPYTDMLECWKEAKKQFKWCYVVEEEMLIYERGYKDRKKLMDRVVV